MSNGLIIFNDNIPHIRQKRFNDCGVACIKMVLNYILKFQNKVLDENELENILKDLDVRHKSLWTIDIAHIFAIYNIRHCMFTTTFGVYENYSNELFYTKDLNFNEEQERINRKFTQLNELRISVFKKHLTIDDIKAQLNAQCVCIVLVDANKLNGYNTNSSENLSDLRLTTNFLTNLVSSVKSRLGYAGHFIVLVGFDSLNKIVFYRNPSTSKCLSYASEESFETARKAYGTDEDIVFVYM